jgi:uncharacterized protein YaiL (DUF2058 family)
MSESLRDQLLKSGLVQKIKAEAKPAPKPQGAGTGQPPRGQYHGQPRLGGKPHGNAPKPQHGARPLAPKSGEPDLAQAYAQRARAEREERERAQREAEQQARLKRERKIQLAKLLEGQSLNAPDADVARHFPHANKIRRIYCTAAQLVELNRGELAVVQQNGRYFLVTRDIGTQMQAIAPECLILLVDPNEPADDDVPADLIW